jgi:hypothetical protein
MASYIFIWAPLVLIGAMVVLLTAPLFALFVLATVFVIALAALAYAVVSVSHALGRAASRHWHAQAEPSPRTAIVLAPSRRQSA